MYNNILYISWIFVALSLMLVAFLLWGKNGILGIIIANLVLMNIFVLKGMKLFGLDATGGNVLYAAVFLGTDIIAEYFGEKEARKTVLIGFYISVFFLLASRFIVMFRPASWDLYHNSLKEIFTPTWRIVGASMLAYLISQNFDVFFYGLLKRLAPGHLWLRNNGSTWCSQAIDTIVFCTAAFVGMYETHVIFGIIASTYILKIVVAALDTPFIYFSKLIVKLRPSILHGK